MADPTMEFLKDLDDPSKWHVVHNVPVIRPHKRSTGKDSKPVVVTEEDLPNIAKTVNAAYSSAGVPIRVTIGHINQDPDADETEQAPIAGYMRDAKVATFGPGKVPCVAVDMYLRKETARQVLAQHPFRSMEFDPVDRRIHGVALLTRDPALDLGVVTYRSKRWLVNYEDMKEDQPDAKKEKPEKGSPGEKSAEEMPGEDVGAVTKDTGTEDDNAPILEQDEGGGEDAEYHGFCKLMQRYIASGGLSAVGPMGGLMPQANMIPAAGEAQAKYQKTAKGKTVSAIDTEVAAMKEQIASLKKERDTQAAARLLDRLQDKLKFNYQKERDVLVSLPSDEARIEHVKYMQENYAEKIEARIGGPLLDTYRKAVPPENYRKAGLAPNGAPENIYEVPENFEKIMAYMKAHPGMQYEQAEAKITELNHKATA